MTAREIINRSILVHPSLFRESLIAQAEMHDNYAALATDSRAIAGAESMRASCLRVYDAAGTECIDEVMQNLGDMVVAVNAAAKLQCLPPHIKAQAIAAWDAGER
jgi:hypothetical protein